MNVLNNIPVNERIKLLVFKLEYIYEKHLYEYWIIVETCFTIYWAFVIKRGGS